MSLQLLHIDLLDPIPTTSPRGIKYTLAIVDDFTRHIWVYFLAHKGDVGDQVIKFIKRVQNEKDIFVKAIRSDHAKEFDY